MSKIALFSRVSTLGQDLTQQTDELKIEAKRLGYEYKYISKKHGVKFEILYCIRGNEYKKLKDFVIIERFKRNRK